MLFLLQIPLVIGDHHDSTIDENSDSKRGRGAKSNRRTKRATKADEQADEEHHGLPEHVEKIQLTLRAAASRGVIGDVTWIKTPSFRELLHNTVGAREVAAVQAALAASVNSSAAAADGKTPPLSWMQSSRRLLGDSSTTDSPDAKTKRNSGTVLAIAQSIDLAESEGLVKSLMSTHGLGVEYGTISLLPTEIQQPRLDLQLDETESAFMQSVKSRVLVEGVLQNTREQAVVSFDFLMLLIVASMLAAVGLATNNAVVVVASMLVSPLMGPILAVTFGLVIRDYSLVRTGAISEGIALVVCVVVGFIIGLMMSAWADLWGGWPTLEMYSRGAWSGLIVGLSIALPSGVGVALSVLGNNTSSLVGVAISASLLPPAVNAGMCMAVAAVWALLDHSKEICGGESPEVLAAAVVRQAVEILQQATSVSVNATALTASGPVPAPLPAAGNETTTAATGGAVPPPFYDYVCGANNDRYTQGDFVWLGFISFLLTLLNILCVLVAAFAMYKLKEVAPLPGKTTFWKKTVPEARNYEKALKPNAKNSKEIEEKLRVLLDKAGVDSAATLSPRAVLSALSTVDTRRESAGSAPNTIHFDDNLATNLRRQAPMSMSDMLVGTRSTRSGLTRIDSGVESGAVPRGVAMPTSLMGLFDTAEASSGVKKRRVKSKRSERS